MYWYTVQWVKHDVGWSLQVKLFFKFYEKGLEQNELLKSQRKVWKSGKKLRKST